MKDDQYYAKLLEIAIPLYQGLLASGHFTQPVEERSPPAPLWVDNGKDFASQGMEPTRFTAVAMDDALKLAEDLMDQIEIMKKRYGTNNK